MTQDLLVQSKGKAPMFITRVRQEVLVLTIRSTGIQKLIIDWRVPDDRHYRVISPSTAVRTQKLKRHKLEQVEWTRKQVELSLVQIEGKEDLETVAVILDTSLRDSFNSSYLVKTVQEKNASWTDGLNKLRKRTRRKLRTALVLISWGPMPVQKAVTRTKVNSWRRFCKSIVTLPRPF